MEDRKIDTVDGIDFSPLFRFLTRYRWGIISALGAAAILVALISVVGPKQYESSAVVAAKNDLSQDSALNGAARFFGGASADQPAYNRFLVLLKSPDLAQRLANDPQFMHIAFYKQWNERDGVWIRTEGPIPSFKRWLKLLLGYRSEETPGPLAVARLLESALTVNSSSADDKNMAAITMTSDDPQRAQALLQIVLKQADEIERAQYLYRARVRIKSILSSLQETNAVEQKSSLIQLLDSSEFTVITATSDANYSFDYVSVPDLANRPKLSVQGTAVNLIGFFFVFFVVYLLVARYLHRQPELRRKFEVWVRI